MYYPSAKFGDDKFCGFCVRVHTHTYIHTYTRIEPLNTLKVLRLVVVSNVSHASAVLDLNWILWIFSVPVCC